MDSALSQLQALIESIRREAEAEGYARAMRDIQSSLTKSLSELKPSIGGQLAFVTTPSGLATDSVRVNIARNPRGHNVNHVWQVLRRYRLSMGATDVVRALEADGVSIAYSSARHALGQLEKEGRAFQLEKGKWIANLTEAPHAEAQEGTI